MGQNRRNSLNSFLISLTLNLLFLLILSLLREPIAIQNKESISVEFSKVPKTVIQRRPSIILPRSSESSIQSKPLNQIATVDTRDIVLPRSLSSTPQGIPRAYGFPQTSSTASPRGSFSLPSQSSDTGQWGSGSDAPSKSMSRGFGKPNGQGNIGITIRQPKAIISGSGDKLSGYYNISLVKYEDTSDTVSADALAQLATAMNKWTEIKTKVIKEPIMLDDPELLQVPMVYITSRRPFAFSELERENLQKYFSNGGFLLFSNTSTSFSEAQGVANSIEFELWKVLGNSARDLNDIGKESEIHKILFDLPDSMKLRGIALDGRYTVIYENSGYGNAWLEGKDTKKESYMKLGVNIILYALSTSPMVQKN